MRLENVEFLLHRIKCAVLHRSNPVITWRCAVQTDRKTVKFTGIANIRNCTAHYASLEHFRHNIPAILPRIQYDLLVTQNFMHDEFIGEHRPKVFFSREPMECLADETRKNLARNDMAPFIVAFDEKAMDKRNFYVALPVRKRGVLKRLEQTISRERKGLCCIVNRYAENEGLNLLVERLKFTQAMDGDIDIFGHAPENKPNGWDEFPSYRGPTRDKLKTLAGYDFNLCFENTDENGYITEKIIHSLMAGCVPLYWGGGCYLEQTVPASCFINCKDQEPTEIYQRIKAMPHTEIVEYRRAGLEFLSSSQADRFTWKYWAELVSRKLMEVSDLQCARPRQGDGK